VKSLASDVCDRLLVGTGWGLLLGPPKASHLQTAPAQLPQPLRKDRCSCLTHRGGSQLNSLQFANVFLVLGAPKLDLSNISQTQKMVSVFMFPTVEEQLMRSPSEISIMQIRSQVGHHRLLILE